jgi:hypothetical protein
MTSLMNTRIPNFVLPQRQSPVPPRMHPLRAHCYRGLGTLYAQTDQAEQARAALSTALAMYQAMEMTFWFPETEAALVQVEGR